MEKQLFSLIVVVLAFGLNLLVTLFSVSLFPPLLLLEVVRKTREICELCDGERR